MVQDLVATKVPTIGSGCTTALKRHLSAHATRTDRRDLMLG